MYNESHIGTQSTYGYDLIFGESRTYSEKLWRFVEGIGSDSIS